MRERTVDGNGNTLVEDIAVSTNESRNLRMLAQCIGILEKRGMYLSEGVDFEVLSRDTLGWLSLNDLEVDAVGNGDSSDRSGSRVTWIGVQLSERHCCRCFGIGNG